MRGRDEAHLAGLLSEVNRARARLRAERHAPQTTTSRRDQRQSCKLLAEAMKAYADAASAAGVPLPYRYRDEMRLNQSSATAY